MVFWKRSTTALFAVLLFFLASTVYTEKAHAQEFKAKTECPMAQFIVVGNASCKTPPKVTPASEFLPTTKLLTQVNLQDNKDKVPEKVESVQTVAPVVNTIETNTATLSADLLFAITNAHRAEIGLPAFEHEPQVCSVAESRRYEMVDEIFTTHNLHAGFYAKNLPYWATENLIWQHTEAEALNWWLNSPIHRSAIEGNYKYACGVCNGEVCNMVFTNYEPKVIQTSVSNEKTIDKNPEPEDKPSLTVKKTISMTLLK